MEKAAQQIRSAQDIFSEQLPLTAWDVAESGPEMVAALDAALSGTHELVRSQYPGDLPKLNACDALFKQAHAGLALVGAALKEPEQPAPVTPVPEAQPLPAPAEKKRTPHVVHTAVSAALAALLVLCAVLLQFTTEYGTVDIPVQFFTDSMLVLIALMALWEVVFRVGRVRAVLDEDGVGGLILLVGKLLKWQWLADIGLDMRKKYRQRLPQWQFSAAASIVIRPAVPDRAALLAKCRMLLQIIDSNLPLFAAPRQTAQKAEYSPMLRAVIQEYYNNREGMSGELQAMLADQLQLNGWTLLDYSPEHEAMFTTQPMTETFTIFPAILDRQQQLIETGFACVKEE